MFRNDNVTAINQPLTTLRLYSCCGHQTVIEDYIGAHQSTVSRIVKRATNIIARLTLKLIFMPKDRDRLHIAKSFYKIAQFPKVLGCIDGTQFSGNKKTYMWNLQQYSNSYISQISNETVIQFKINKLFS